MRPVRLFAWLTLGAATALAIEVAVLSWLRAATHLAPAIPFIVTLGAAAVMVRRASPLFRALGRTPPSPTALRDAIYAPERLVVASLLGHGVAALFLVFESTLLGLLLLGLGALAAVGLGLGARGAFRRWVDGFPEEDIRCDVSLPTARRLAPELSLLTGGSGLTVIVLAAVVADLSTLVVVLSVGVALAGGAVAAWLGARAGAELDAQFRTLARRIDELEDGSTVLAGEGLVEPEILRVRDDVLALADAHLADASQEDRTRRGLEELQRQKMLFLASMSHDLRAPLNAILGFSEMLADPEAGLTEGQRESAREINQAGADLLALLNDIVDSARFSVGKLPLHREWVPAVDILNAVEQQGDRLVEGTEKRIVAELQAGLPPVFVDRTRIVQAVVCLLRHAVRSMDQGVIRLRAWVSRHAQEELRVAVIDESEGIRPEDKERIFEAFRELSLPSGRRVGGLGLGLSLARSLVTAHAGEVRAETSKARGTTFTVCLPVQMGPSEAAREVAGEPSAD